MRYRFTGAYTRFYPAVEGPDGPSLEVSPGDEIDFPDGAPGDGQWVPLDAPIPVPGLFPVPEDLEPEHIIAPPGSPEVPSDPEVKE